MESTVTNPVSLVELWQVFRKRWIVMALISLLLAAIVGTGHALLYTPIYSSSSQYYVSNVADDTPLYTNAQTSAAAEMAEYCAEFLYGDVVLESVLETADLTDAERAELTVPRLRSMTDTSTISALIRVTVAGPDASLNHRLAQAIEKVLPIYCDLFNNQDSLKTDDGNSQNGSNNQDVFDSNDGNTQDSSKANGGEKDSYMLKVTDRSKLDRSADNAGTLIKYPLMVLFLSFVVSYLIFVIIHFFDTTIYTRDDIKEKLPNTPIFGVIPHWGVQTTKEHKKNHIRKKQKNQHKFAEKRVILKEDTPFFVTEAFRQFSTNVTFCSSGEKGCTIGMVSARAATGKSFLVANLAVSLSQRIDKKILLVDADMRCPMIHRIFEIKNTVGLSQLLTGQVANDSTIYHLINGSSLTVLTAGEIPPNPLELLTSPKMKTLIDEWKKEYDYVLFDLPPVGEVVDAMALSESISGYLFAIRSGVSDIRDVLETISSLEERGVKVHGCVLTDVEKKSSSYSYSYYYGYGSERKDTKKPEVAG